MFEVPNLKPGDVIMNCLVRAITHFRGDITVPNPFKVKTVPVLMHHTMKTNGGMEVQFHTWMLVMSFMFEQL
jgi:hypothetical protein